MNQENQKPKKVLFVITKATWGGAQRYVYDLATHLPKGEFELIVAYGTRGKLAEDLTTAGITVRQLPSLGRDISLVSDIKSFFEIWRTIREIRPDIVHLNSSKTAALGALAARLCGVRHIVFTVHGWPFKESRNIAWKILTYKISWFTALLSHSVIVVSRSDEARGKHMALVGKKTHYIPIGIEIPKFITREESSLALKINVTTPRIVTNAELTANKGIRYAIEAVALLKNRGIDVSYFVISDGEEREILEAFARKKDVSDRVYFFGFLKDAARYLNVFDIFVLPSIKEGMPYALLEAAAAGLPIVATDIVKACASNIPNIHFVPPGDGGALADAVENLTRNMPTKTPSTIWSFRDMLKQTLDVYAQKK
ncbi:MAG: glycosyltransferase [bacterium]|nr:glycosyltransferase [bacterium]